jgi:hypothetical protein
VLDTGGAMMPKLDLAALREVSDACENVSDVVTLPHADTSIAQDEPDRSIDRSIGLTNWPNA